MNGDISAEDRKSMNSSLEKEALEIQKQLLEVDKIQTIDIDVISEVLDLTKNIAKTYREADIFRKRAYLHFFFKKILIGDKKIVKIEYQPVIEVLKQANTVILSTSWLENRNPNITTQLVCICPEHIRQAQCKRSRRTQIREEIEKVNLPYLMEIL